LGRGGSSSSSGEKVKVKVVKSLKSENLELTYVRGDTTSNPATVTTPDTHVSTPSNGTIKKTSTMKEKQIVTSEKIKPTKEETESKLTTKTKPQEVTETLSFADAAKHALSEEEKKQLEQNVVKLTN